MIQRIIEDAAAAIAAALAVKLVRLIAREIEVRSAVQSLEDADAWRP